MLQILQHILQYQLFHYWLSIDSQFPTSNFAYKKDTKAMKQIITSLGFIIKPLENNLPFSTVSFFFIWCNNSVCHAFHKKPSGSYHLSVSQIQTHPSSFYSSLSESTPDTNSDPKSGARSAAGGSFASFSPSTGLQVPGKINQAALRPLRGSEVVFDSEGLLADNDSKQSGQVQAASTPRTTNQPTWTWQEN